MSAGVSPTVEEWFQVSQTTNKYIDQLNFMGTNKEIFDKLHQHLFVINLRTYGKESEETWAPESDTVFINVLKMLLEKKGAGLKIQDFARNLQLVTDVADFLPNIPAFIGMQPEEEKDKYQKALLAVFGDLATAHNPSDESELQYLTLQLKQCLSLSLRCAAAISQLGENWTSALQEDTMWRPPKSWSIPVQLSEPFETYLKARWGHKLLGLLGLQVEYLGWWNAPPRPKGAKSQSSSDAAAAASASYSNASKKGAKKKKAAKQSKAKPEEEPTSWLPEQYLRGESFEPYYNQGHLAGDFFGLFHKCPIKCKVDEKSVKVKHPRNAMGEKWHYEEHTFCPPLTGELGIGRAVTGKQVKLSTWACLWQHTSNHKIQILLQRMHHNMLFLWSERDPDPASCESDIMKDWMENITRSSSMIDKVKNERGEENEARRIQEVLLPSHLVAQLPWNTAVLQPWLAAALIIIQKFEMESLELRHWPMHPDVELLARELLALVCHAKERILLVLALYFKQVLQDYAERSWCQMLLVEGVLPTLPVLEMLSSGVGAQLLSEIKALAWGQRKGRTKNMLFVNPQAYNPLPQLDNIYLNMIWHVKYWLSTEQDEPFPVYLLRNMQPLEVLAQLSKGQVPPIKNDGNSVSPFSVQERGLFELWYDPQSPSYWLRVASLEKRIEMVTEVLKKVEAEGWFSDTLLKSLSETYSLPEGLTCVQDLGNVQWQQNEKSMELQIAIYGTFYFRFLGSLFGINRETSEFGWLVRLSGELLEREQLVRTSQVISLYLDIAPQLKLCYPYPRTCAQLLEEVRSIASQRRERTVDWLWSQLPTHWLHPVVIHEYYADVSLGVGHVISHFENRLGSILGGVIKESCRVLDSGGCVFPNWYAVQCLMPIYIGDLSACANNVTAITNLSKLLHQLLRNLEQQFLKWSAGVTGPELDGDCKVNEIDPDLAVPSGNILQQQLETLLYAYVGRHVNLDKLPGFEEARLQIENWWRPMPFEDGKAEGELVVFKAWCKIALEQTTILLHACQKAWNMPIPEPDPANARSLKSLYFLSHISDHIQCSVDMFLILNKFKCATSKKVEFQRNLLIAILEQNSAQSGDSDKKGVRGLKKREVESLDKNEVLKHFSKLFKRYRDTKVKIGAEHFPQPYWTGSESKAVKDAVTTFLKGSPEQLIQLEIQLNIRTGRVCSNKECGIAEEELGQFIMCDKCIQGNFPNPNVFCTKKCERKWWKLEHMAQHLEYELGIE